MQKIFVRRRRPAGFAILPLMFRQLEEMKGGELLPELLRATGRRHRGVRSVPPSEMIQTFSEVVGQDLKPWFRKRWNLGMAS